MRQNYTFVIQFLYIQVKKVPFAGFHQKDFGSSEQMYASTDVLYSSSILVVKAVACKQGKPLEDFLLSVTVSSAGLSVRLVSSDESFRRQQCLKPRPSSFLQYHHRTLARQYNAISIFYTDLINHAIYIHTVAAQLNNRSG